MGSLHMHSHRLHQVEPCCATCPCFAARFQMFWQMQMDVREEKAKNVL
jgi:hypothetical protein